MHPSLSTVATCIKTTWDSHEDCKIQKSFKKCSISNNLDKTEDDILWTDVCDDSHDTYNDTDRRTSQEKILPTKIFLGFEQ